MEVMLKIIDIVVIFDGICVVCLFIFDGLGCWFGVVMFFDVGGVWDIFDWMVVKLVGFGYVVLFFDVYYCEGDWVLFDMKIVFGDL